jgi:hypothetical protein
MYVAVRAANCHEIYVYRVLRLSFCTNVSSSNGYISILVTSRGYSGPLHPPDNSVYSFSKTLFYLQYGGSKVIRNFSNILPNHMTSHSIRNILFSLPLASASFFTGFLFYPQDGGNIFLRKFWLCPNYTVSKLWRLYSLKINVSRGLVIGWKKWTWHDMGRLSWFLHDSFILSYAKSDEKQLKKCMYLNRLDSSFSEKSELQDAVIYVWQHCFQNEHWSTALYRPCTSTEPIILPIRFHENLKYYI